MLSANTETFPEPFKSSLLFCILSMTHAHSCQSAISLRMSRQILGGKASTAKSPVPTLSLTSIQTCLSINSPLGTGHPLSHHSHFFVLWKCTSKPNNDAHGYGDSLTVTRQTPNSSLGSQLPPLASCCHVCPLPLNLQTPAKTAIFLSEIANFSPT